MADLTKTCQGLGTPVDMPNCKPGIGNPIGLILATPGTIITAVASIPTPAELIAFLSAGYGQYIALANGAKKAVEIERSTREESRYGVPEDRVATTGITGEIHNFDNAVLTFLRQFKLNNDAMQIWYITRDGRFFGEKTGYLTNVINGDFERESSFAGIAKIPVDLTWFPADNQDLQMSDVNAAYLTIESNIVLPTV